MSKEVKIDQTKFQAMLKAMRKGVPLDGKKIVKNEARLLIADLVEKSIPKDVARAKRSIVKVIKIAYKSGRRGVGSVPIDRLYAVRKGARGKRVVVQREALKQFVKEQKKHIGYLAKGWLGDSNPLQAKEKPLTKHHVAKGHTKITDTLLRFKIVITNLVPYAVSVKGYTYLVQKALNSRVAKMRANLALIKQGVKKYQLK